MKLDELIKFTHEVEAAMMASGYSETTVKGHRKIWRKFIVYSQANEQSDCDLSAEGLSKFIDKCYLGKGKADQLCKAYKQRIVRAVGILSEYKAIGKKAFFHHIDRKSYSCPEPFKAHIQDYYTAKCEEGMSESWKVSFTAEMRKFVTFLLDNSICDFETVSATNINQYILELSHYSPSMLSGLLGRLRGFYRWMYENSHTKHNVAALFPTVNRCSFPSHLPAVWKLEEIEKILGVIDRESAVGKRDYAVLLLLSKTGLRAGDALFLEYSNINWDSCTIELVQSKTNTPIALPLHEDVGLAIIDYLQSGRPESDSQCIFIRHTPPFQPFTSGHRFHYQINKYLEIAGVSKPIGKSVGAHSFRHTLATQMLKNKTPLPTIAEVLGHKSVHSTANYLRVDIDQLRACALEIGGSL